MKLPLLISVPHAGLTVPPIVVPYCTLTHHQIVEDGDEGATEVYHGLRDDVAAFVATPIARAILDVNRAEDDRSPDGVVKTHTCWNVPVYHQSPPEDVVHALLDEHYHPYHRLLREAATQHVALGVDCHTMAAKGPPIGPCPGTPRPRVCLSNGQGTCPQDWIESLAGCVARAFKYDVAINDPFKGGYIIHAHAQELPWVQLELTRAPFLSNAEKHQGVLTALREWCHQHTS
jgi:formiminoglutamase